MLHCQSINEAHSVFFYHRQQKAMYYVNGYMIKSKSLFLFFSIFLFHYLILKENNGSRVREAFDIVSNEGKGNRRYQAAHQVHA